MRSERVVQPRVMGLEVAREPCIEPLRELVITGWSWGDAGQALGITVALAAVTTTLAFLTLRARLRRL